MPSGVKKVCSRGHVYYKTSDCPECPTCWSGDHRAQQQADFPDKLSAPALRALLNANIVNLAQLAQYSKQDVLALHGLGPTAIPLLEKALKEKGLTFTHS